MSISVASASASQYPQIIDILVEAFTRDPGFLRIIPQPDHDQTKLRSLFELQIEKQYAIAGKIDIALNEQEQLVGVALWDSPEGNHSAKDQLALLPPLTKIFGVGTAKVLRAELQSARFHPRFPHWYLYTLASIPSARGTGVGSALLNYGIARAGEEAVYLEATTTRSAQLYQRLGFVPLGYVPSKDDLPSELAMWKPPAMPKE